MVVRWGWYLDGWVVHVRTLCLRIGGWIGWRGRWLVGWIMYTGGLDRTGLAGLAFRMGWDGINEYSDLI